MDYIIIILFSYLLGCSSMSYYISKINKVDIKGNGSKNLGASNTIALVGWKAGLLVLVHDILKSVIAVLIARYLYPDLIYGGAIAGVSCIIGHIFPFYLHFDGGKGFASFVGLMLALDFKFALVMIVIILTLAFITDYIVVGTMSAISVVPIYLGIVNHDFVLFLILMVTSLIVLYKHRVNLVRIYNGTETKIRNAHKGELRMK